MKVLIKISLFLLLALNNLLCFGQQENEYKKIFNYENILNIDFFTDTDSNISISLQKDLTIVDDDKIDNYYYPFNRIKTDSIVNVLNKFGVLDEVFFLLRDDKGAYESTRMRIINGYGIHLFIQVDLFDFMCGDTFFILIFDKNKAIDILKEISKFYNDNNNGFVKLIEIIENNSNAEIKGFVHSSVNNKIVSNKVYVRINETNDLLKVNDKGEFSVYNLKNNSKYTLTIKAKGYDDVEFKIKTNDSILKKDFDIKGNCEFNRIQAEQDWQYGNAKILLKADGISYANRIIDNEFELRYNIEYLDFGCMPPSEKCIKQYNRRIFELMDEKFGLEWRKETRFDVAYLDKKDVERLINKMKN